MSNRSIINVVLLGTFAITTIIGVQAYYIQEAYLLKDSEFDQRVRIVLRKVAERIAGFNGSDLPAYNLIHREASNYYIVNIEDDIDANVLEHYLYAELSKASLKLDFEYAVFDCFSKDMVYGNYCKLQTDEAKVVHSHLPKYEEFTYYFGVRFPTRAAFILESTSRFWIAAFLLLLTISFFAYSVYIILSQKRMSEMQKDFINNMTHEFKTPISSIKISADYLAQEPYIGGHPKLKKYVRIIKEQHERLNSQVEKVLNIAKLEKDQFKLKIEPIPINDLVRDVVMTRISEVEAGGGVMKLDLMKDDVVIQADAVHFTNVLHNLIDNAIKYSKEDVDILIRTRKDGRKTVFEVRDSGIGISKENIGKISKKFFRVPSGNIHNVKGFGLGLYYVSRMCKAHDWEFSIESQLNEGTSCFIVFS